jgi:hypothetical protein
MSGESCATCQCTSTNTRLPFIPHIWHMVGNPYCVFPACQYHPSTVGARATKVGSTRDRGHGTGRETLLTSPSQMPGGNSPAGLGAPRAPCSCCHPSWARGESAACSGRAFQQYCIRFSSTVFVSAVLYSFQQYCRRRVQQYCRRDWGRHLLLLLTEREAVSENG